MACFVPFNNRNLDVSFFVLRPMVVLVDELVEVLKHFSFCTESLGCVHSALLKSIHGNMVIWYGAWLKRSNQNKDLLNAALLSMLTNVSSMAILIDYGFFEAYAGDSRDGSHAAKFSTGDTISVNATLLYSDHNSNDSDDLSYACLAIFRSHFLKMDGANAGVCLRGEGRTRVLSLVVWRSLHSCYSWVLNADYRKTVLPYLDGRSLDLKYDIFRVIYVSGENATNFQICPPHHMLENEAGDQAHKILQD